MKALFIMLITSKQNPTVVAAAKLKEKKSRQERQRFLIEGEKLVLDAAKHGIKLEEVFGTEENRSKFSSLACKITEVSQSVMSYLCDAKTNQGVAAVAVLPMTKPFDGKKALLLDRIQDPRNIGAILRTACATDYRNIFLIDCADVFSPVALRCGMSGQFLLNFYETSQEEFLRDFGDGFIICADMNGKDVFSSSAPKDHFLVLGNEGQGVSSELKKAAKMTVSIPMQNNMESLNVAVSGGIIMYQLSHR